MRWQDVCEHPGLKNLPFKIELDEYGKIIMFPVNLSHSAFQGEIEFVLRTLLKTEKTLPECAIKTSKGTKVADVAWVSLERFQIIKEEVECSIAPEICIDVISSSNSTKEMDEKRALYFATGTKEFWICDENGALSFFDKDSKLSKSSLVPPFPAKINW